MLLLRALIAFVAMPGLVGIAIPAWWAWRETHGRVVHAIGLVPLGIGVVALLWCVRDFYVTGKGTLAPWSPPRELVVVGLYRFTRNPMYVAVVVILAGWALAFASPGLAGYALCVAVAFELRVVFGEEPWLARTHGDAWVRYVGRVPRWFW